MTNRRGGGSEDVDGVPLQGVARIVQVFKNPSHPRAVQESRNRIRERGQPSPWCRQHEADPVRVGDADPELTNSYY